MEAKSHVIKEEPSPIIELTEEALERVRQLEEENVNLKAYKNVVGIRNMVPGTRFIHELGTKEGEMLEIKGRKDLDIPGTPAIIKYATWQHLVDNKYQDLVEGNVVLDNSVLETFGIPLHNKAKPYPSPNVFTDEDIQNLFTIKVKEFEKKINAVTVGYVLERIALAVVKNGRKNQREYLYIIEERKKSLKSTPHSEYQKYSIEELVKIAREKGVVLPNYLTENLNSGLQLAPEIVKGYIIDMIVYGGDGSKNRG